MGKSPEVETLRLFFQQEEDMKIRRLVFLLAQEMVGCGGEELMELEVIKISERREF